MKENSLYLRMILWREKNIKEEQFILILSIVIGIITGLSAVLLKFLIHSIEFLLTDTFSVTEANIMYFVYPAIGILLAVLYVRFFVKDDIGHGVTKILYSISRRQGRIKRHNILSSIIASSLTIGFGGSVGSESPIVLTGAAIGSNLGSYFKMNHKTLMLLIGCGASAGIAGIFKAPIAGLVFTIEVIMLDMTFASMLPLLMASVSAASISYFFWGADSMFNFVLTDIFTLDKIPWTIVLGVACGLVSLYVIRGMSLFEAWYKKKTNPFQRILYGGLALGILIFLFPPLYGEGYSTIGQLLNGHPEMLTTGSMFFDFRDNIGILLLYMTVIVFFKVLATASTNGAGGVGGIFAPSLFIGAVLGFVVGCIVNYTGIAPVSPANFALMGMAGVMSAVMHAPLTGVFLIAELTGGFSLLLPLLIVSGVAFLTIYIFEKHSIYSLRLAQKGELITHHKDKAVLTLMKIENVVETNFDVVKPEMYLGDMVKVIAKAKRNIFPVVDDDNVLQGVVLLDDIRNIMFRTELYNRFKVRKLMISPPAKIYIDESMEMVMRIFDDTNAWNLPVIDREQHYLGFVSKSKIFNTYRQVLVHFSDE